MRTFRIGADQFDEHQSLANLVTLLGVQREPVELQMLLAAAIRRISEIS